MSDLKAKVKNNPDTFCNPVNISYQYQRGFRGRESADPTVIMFKNEYYLFASRGSGYWWSADLTDWHFIFAADGAFDTEKYAPTACAIGNALYLTHSENGSVYKTTDPKSGQWEYTGHPAHWNDPALFADDDGRVYCYYGCSDNEPIYVLELDPKNNLQAPCAYPCRHGFPRL